MKRRTFINRVFIGCASFVFPISVLKSEPVCQLDDSTILLYAKLKACAYGQDVTYIRKYYNETKCFLDKEIKQRRRNNDCN